MKRSFVGPGGLEYPSPPKRKELVPTMTKEWPDLGVGKLLSFLFFATHVPFFHTSLEGGVSVGGAVVVGVVVGVIWSGTDAMIAGGV
jgi:hypothetical protein